MSKSNKAVESNESEVKPLANINGVYVHPETKINWLTESNPKRPSGKAHARFEAYMGKSTVADYLAAGGTTADLKYDQQKGFLEIVE